MDKKEMNAAELIAEMIINMPLPENAPADIKLSREMIRFSSKVSKAAKTASESRNDALCAQIYAIMRDTNDKILALCNGEAIQEESVKPVFQVGQRVQFKTWEEMEAEFGLDSDGDIANPCIFTRNMKSLCGTKATIKEIDDQYVKLIGLEEEGAAYFYFDIYMLKPAQEV